MANLSRIFSPYDLVDPYPTFGVYSAGQTNPWFHIYDSNFGMIAAGQNLTTTEGYGNIYNNSYDYTTSTVGTSSSTYWVAATPANQAEGNYVISPTPFTQNGSSYVRGTITSGDNWSQFGTVIGHEGVRQKISIRQNDSALSLHYRGGTQAIDYVSMTNFANFSGAGTNGLGQVSYNDRTKTLVVLTMSNGTANYRAHVYRNPNRNINTPYILPGEFRRFITEAYAGTAGASYYYNDFSWNTSSTTSYSESMMRVRVVLGDNGIIGLFRMTPSTQAVWAYATLNSGGTTATITSLGSDSIATSYGVEQGARFGSRTNITWDNNWVVAYCPYYYYGGGIVAVMFYTQDPTKHYWLRQQSSSGCALVPFMSNKFLWSEQANSDGGVGLNVRIIDPEGYRANSLGPSGNAVANGANVSSETVYTTQMIDIPYSSTYYPCLLAMHQWTKP